MDPSVGTLVQLAISLHTPITDFFPSWIRKILRPEDLSPAEE